jgi:hypothetical protein
VEKKSLQPRKSPKDDVPEQGFGELTCPESSLKLDFTCFEQRSFPAAADSDYDATNFGNVLLA